MKRDLEKDVVVSLLWLIFTARLSVQACLFLFDLLLIINVSTHPIHEISAKMNRNLGQIS